MNKPEIPAFLLALAAVVGVVMLTVLGDKVPDILNVIAGTGVGVGAAITIPRSSSS